MSALRNRPEPRYPTLKVTGLRPDQVEDALKMLRVERARNASAVGSGKTATTLAAIEEGELYPAVIVTVKNGRLSWAREALHWLDKRRTVTVLQGLGRAAKQKPFQLLLPDGTTAEVPINDLSADLIILNYDVLYAWDERLAELRPRSLTLDESHKVAHRSRRTKAALKLALKGTDGRAIPYRFCLSATPVLGRPAELIPQLQILNRLKEVGGYPYFITRYCNAKTIEVPVFNKRLGRREWRKVKDISGANKPALKELYARMQPFTVRRTTEELMPWMEPVQRVTVPVELSNRKDYDRAERDFLDWVGHAALEQRAFKASLAGLSVEAAEAARRERSESAAFAARQSEALVKLTYLRQLCGLGKVEAAGEWIEDFLESGQKLLAFAYHQDVQYALLERFPKALHIFADDSSANRQAAVDRFQLDPTARFMLLSQEAAENLTLTAAHYVLFPELNWTPAIHHQCEGRARGRSNDPHNITSYYLIGTASVDEVVQAANLRKQEVGELVTDGTLTAQTRSVLDDVKREYVRRAQARLFA